MLQGGSASVTRPAWLDEWARFAVRLTYDELPAATVDRTKQVLFDCIGAIAAGAQEPEVQRLTDKLLRRGSGSAPVVGAHMRGPPGVAAFLNGLAGTMLEIDEGNQFARGHPGIHVVPAALAAAQERGATGRELLVAIALGYEIGSRIGIASKLRVTMHPHGTWGTVGAALAAARLNHASPEATFETVNVASTLGLATSRRTMLEGGTVRNSFAGFSNEIGLRAWDMVEAGFVGELDGVGTIFGSVAAEGFAPAEMTRDLGDRWEIARNYFKRHAACRYNHGAIDALLRLIDQEGGRIAPEAIERIEVDTYIWAAQLDSQEPRNMLAAKFSLPFTLATTIVTGAASIPAFRDPAREDEQTRDLARRVSVREDPALTTMLPGLRPARVAIFLKGGRALRAEALTNKGDTEDPYSAEEIREKFHGVAAPIWDKSHRDAILRAVDELDRAADVGTLLDLVAA
jgi:2-methylcitrate dehydratase PrpD